MVVFVNLECDLGVPIKIKGYIVYWGPPYLSKLQFVSEVSEHSWDGLLCGSGFPIALAYWLSRVHSGTCYTGII